MPDSGPGAPSPALTTLPKRLWSRRWVRRLTYLVAAGATVVGVTTWTLNRPFFNRWLIDRVADAVLAETGLPLTASRLELAPVRGHFVLHDFTFGGDLLQARRLEVYLDMGSLLTGNPHIYAVRLDDPNLVLSQARLDAIHLKPRPKPAAEPPQVRVDFLRINGGRVRIEEPEWGIPRGTFRFEAATTGLGPNHVKGGLDAQAIALDLPKGHAEGRLQVVVDASDKTLRLNGARLTLGPATLEAQGELDLASKRFTAEAKGNTELAQTLRLLTGEPRGFRGSVTFQATAEGTPKAPQWTLELDAPEIQPLERPFHAGRLAVRAKGTLDRAALDLVRWTSVDGVAELHGSWSRGRTTQLDLSLKDVDLNPLAAWSRVDSLRDLRAVFEGELEVPGDPWSVPRWDRVRVQAKGALTRFDAPMGDLDLDVAAGEVSLHGLNLRLDALQVDGQGTARLDRRGLASLEANGFAITDAARVADTLRAWKIVDLDMAGWVRGTADHLTWNRADGLQLTAQAEIVGPRWHDATADRVTTQVRIDRDQITLRDIVAERKEGRGFGDIWVTWGPTAPGADQLDMCFRADRLPVEQGIAAADLDLPLGGTASGWARLHGPFDRILMDGQAVVERGQAYGLSLPAVSGSFWMDLEGSRLRIPELRLAERLDDLAPDADQPRGTLALKGRLDMDLKRETWFGALDGALDTGPLGLGGPRFQGRMTGRLEGPWTTSLGPWSLPLGSVRFTDGRLFLGEQSLEGLEGSLATEPGGARVEAGVVGKPARFLQGEAHALKDEALAAAVKVDISPETMDADRLARRSTRDLLQDLRLQAHGAGVLRAENLTWTGTIDALRASLPGFDLVQTRPSALQGDLARAQVDLEVQGIPRFPGAEAPAPGQADLHLAGAVPFSAQGPLDLRMNGLAQVGTLKGMLDLLLDLDENSLLAQLRPQGRTQVELRATGTPEEPFLDGHVALHGGSLSLRTYPQSVEDLSFRVLFQGRDMILPETDPLRGKLAQGEFTAHGKATWEVGGLASYDLKADLKDFQLRDLPGLEGLDLNGTLSARLTGTDEEGGLLKGTVVGDRVTYHADIRLADLLLNSSLASTGGLDVDDPLSRIALDLDLVMKQPWRFDTNLLKVEGRPDGQFKVLGNLVRPGLKGKMVLVPGGRVTNLLPAGDIVLERGDLDFTDPYVLNPVVNLQGRVDVPPYLVNLNLTGTLDQLEFNATSTPSLRQDEVASILIDPALAPTLGTGASSQSQLNYGIASAAQGLLGSLALSALQEQVRKTFNLDRANVTVRSATGSTETTVTLGKTVPFFGRRVPLIGTYRRAGEIITTSGQAEWRIGNWVIQIGASRTTPNETNPTGEVRYTWSPKR